MAKTMGVLIGSVLLILGFVPSTHAADTDAGKIVAQSTCQACHGMNGIGITDQYPDLAGQKSAYLALQLKAFRDGDRSNAIMGPLAKPLSDADIANVSAYYSSLGCASP